MNVSLKAKHCLYMSYDLHQSCFVCIQSTTPVVRSCSWEWPTSMLSGTVSRLSGLSAVKSQIQESKSIYLTFLSERLCPLLHLPLPPLFHWVHNTVMQHHTETGTLPQSCSCWGCQLSICMHQPTARVLWVSVCPCIYMRFQWLGCVFSTLNVCREAERPRCSVIVIPK